MNIKTKVVVIVEAEDGRVLLIKENLDKKPVPLWNIIKGSYEGGETIFEAACRECQEESQLNVKLINSLGVYISEEKEKIRMQFNFLARASNPSDANVVSREEQALRNEAIEEVRWFTREEIMSMDENEFVSTRSYSLIQDWLSDKKYPLKIYRQVKM
ncbi:MAG: NUDIX hydrolase [Parcubacteria group bacterium]|jgi:ADP-ribose pyrophosphatase YjhB (NUDIX family)